MKVRQRKKKKSKRDLGDRESWRAEDGGDQESRQQTTIKNIYKKLVKNLSVNIYILYSYCT